MDFLYLKNLFNDNLENVLKKPKKNDSFKKKELNEAMRYAMLGPGKRIRPMLLLLTSLSLVKKEEKKWAIKMAMPSALALEFVHGYSLVHDDLPCMDNDCFRRGKLSLHAKFGEALAILVGDALFSMAYFCLSKANEPIKQLIELHNACGHEGLILGQMMDLDAQKNKDKKNEWMSINYLKTAKLFETAAVLGGLSINAPKKTIENLREIGIKLGLLYQMKDDLDDHAGLFNVLDRTDILSKINNIKNDLLENNKIQNNFLADYLVYLGV